MKPNYFIILTPLLAGFFSSCATKKGPETVQAIPLVIPQRKGVTDWAVQNAPRTQPGRVMDPQAVTYAQVPKRILFMPGENGIFGRTSPQQEVAYDLVPVDRIPEVQAQRTPAFQPNLDNTPKTSTATFTDSTGNLRKGNARRLGIVNKTTRERNRAESILSKKETLEWLEGVGWVGFTETQHIDVNKKTTEVPPPNIPAPDEVKPVKPEMETPEPPSIRPKTETPKSEWGLDAPMELDGF